MPLEPRPPAFACTGVSLGYDGETVLDGVDLSVSDGEVLALLGPSGSGKSTLLGAAAGFVSPLAGTISLAGRVVAGVGTMRPPEQRDVGVVFQNYALWPHMRARDTVAYPARRAGVSRQRARRHAEDLLERLGVGDLADRYPAQLSGGEQQRIGLARALAREAGLLLFDEPTAHLDAHVREVFIEELAARRRASGVAALYATHDSAEALALADRVALLGDGGVVQVGSTVEVHDEPMSVWAARLTGTASVITARVVRRGDGLFGVDVAGHAVEAAGTASAEPDSGQLATVILRPGWATFDGPLTGEVAAVRFRGPHTDHHVRTGGGDVVVRAPGPPRRAVGEAVTWGIERVRILAGCASSGRIPVGDRDELLDESAFL